MEASLVTVICLCYNHEKYVVEAVESVIAQTYKKIELIIVNDGSTDDSRKVIELLVDKYSFIKFIDHKVNIGMCGAFNSALTIAQGDYIIDLAADDVLIPERIEKQVEAFEKLDDSWGVVFTDAWILNEKGEENGTFYRRDNKLKLLENVITGDVFREIVVRYQICSPTIMARRKVFSELGGYDSSLAYEDYDFFVRSSRNYKYFFLDNILIYKRELPHSTSSKFYMRNENLFLSSTLKVLKKYLWLCRNESEMESSLYSIRYHMRQALYMECYDLAIRYYQLIKDLGKVKLGDRLIYFFASVKFPLNLFYRFYSFIAHKR